MGGTTLLHPFYHWASAQILAHPYAHPSCPFTEKRQGPVRAILQFRAGSGVGWPGQGSRCSELNGGWIRRKGPLCGISP